MPDLKLESENKKSEENNKMNNEDILIKAVGRFGKYQLWLFVFAAVVNTFEGWANDEYIFTTARINKRCLIPECESANPEFSPSWIQNAIPGSNSSFEQCKRYVSRNVTSVNGTCSEELFDTEITQDCDQFVYENTNTVVYDFDLGCDEWKRSSLGSMRMIGRTFSHAFTGFISDKWGRKIGVAINLVASILFGIARFWAFDYYSFAILEFLEAVAGSSAFVCAYVLGVEYVGIRYREMSIAIFTSAASLGHFVQIGILLLIPNWRYYTLTLFSIMIVGLAYLPFMHESIRWLMSTDQYEKAEQTIRKVAKVNGRTVPQNIIYQLQEQKRESEKEKEVVKDLWLPVVIWKNKRILINLVVSSLWSATVKFVLYGLTLNSISISGNAYANYLLLYVAGFVGYFGTIFVTPRVKRKTLVCTGLLLCGLCMFSFIFLSNEHGTMSLIVFLMGKLFISVLLNATYIYTMEMFPTKYRHRLFSIVNFVGQMGAIVATLTPALADSIWVHLPFALYAGFCVLSAALVYIIAETSGKNLPDTIEDVCENSTENK